ncbi:MAG TPA: metallopeptidase TldD-related protein [Dehalococcoidia bacterium]|nr:metallopeptidase TldD-related protein [Dehalococcoidia bacterium]
MTTTSSNPGLEFMRERYGIDTSTAQALLSAALSRGGDYAELYFEHRTSGNILFEQQAVKSANRSISQGLGVRVLLGEAVGYAYTEDLSRDAMTRAAETAAKIAARGDKAPPVDIVSYETAHYYAPGANTLTVPADDKVQLMRRADAAAREFDSSIARVDMAFVDELKYVAIFTSDGRMTGDVQPLVRFNVSCLSERDGERQNARWGGGGRMGMAYFDANPPEELAREAARQAVLLQSAVEAPAGTFPVVLASGDSGILLHEAIGHGLEADFNRKKTSNYSGRIGELVASPLCSIVDDGTIADSRGSINIDDEGNLPSYNMLIENGILQAYLQDRISAQAMGTRVSGNGRRQSFKHYPMPRMTNTYMLAGQESPDDIVRSVNKGIYCVAFSGGQVNISNGDFVFSVTEGYMIEDGKITAPIRNVNLIGNGPDVLTKVTAVGHDYRLSDGRWTCGKDGQSVPVGVGIPTVLVSGMTVGGTAIG